MRRDKLVKGCLKVTLVSSVLLAVCLIAKKRGVI